MPGQPRATAPSRELLLANHRFPGPYVIKAFGPASDRFREGIAAAAVVVVGEARAAVQHRTSSRGRRVCVTLTVNAFTVDEVIDVYDRIHRVPDLMLIL
jgi:putative lipoic acid-binding regulatory protein